MKYLALSLLFLVGCGEPFVKTNVNNQTACIAWPDEHRVKATVRESCSAIHPDAIACIRKYPSEDNIYVMWAEEPKDLDDRQGFEIIGHELYHAIRGGFHPQPNKKE